MPEPTFFSGPVAVGAGHSSQAFELQNGGFAILHKVQTSASTYNLELKFFDAAGEEFSSSVIQTDISEDDSSYSFGRVGASLVNGDIVVVWASPYTLRDYSTIYASRFNSNGDPIGDPIVIAENNPLVPNVNFYQDYQIAALDNGGFVVSWDTFLDESPWDNHSFIQFFDADGVATSAEIDITGGVTHSAPLVTQLWDAGSTVAIAYQDWSTNGFRIQFRTDAGVLTAEPEIVIPTASTYALVSDIRPLSSGGFVIVWSDVTDNLTPTPDTRNIYMQIYDANFDAVAAPILVNDAPGRVGHFPQVVELSDGDIFITWEGTTGVLVGEPNSFNVVYGQRFNSDGTPDGGSFLIGGTGIGGSADSQTVSLLDDGRIVLSWSQTGITSYRILDPRESGVSFAGDDNSQRWYGTAYDDTISGGGNWDQLFGGGGADTLNGDAGDDGLDGGAGTDIVNGGAGNDWLDINASEWLGAETYDGGADWDTLYVNFDTGNFLNLTTGTISNIEGIEFDNGGQLIPNVTVLINASVVTGAPSNFSLTGSEGSVVDVLFITSPGGPINLNTSGWQFNNYATDWISYAGNAGNDTYVGSNVVDAIRSGGGVDNISTGGGNDIIFTMGNAAGSVYNAGSGSDALVVEGGAGSVAVIGGIGAYANGLYSSTLTSIEALNFSNPTGVLPSQNMAKAAQIYANQIGGGQLATNLVLVGHSGFSDVLHIVMTTGGTLNLSAFTFSNWNALFGAADLGEDYVGVSGSASADNITGTSQGDYILAGDGVDQLYGGAGHDTLDGGTGADSMFGGDGNDTYYVDVAGDQTYEAQSTWGTDTVYSTALAYTLGANIDNLILSGSSNSSGSGNLLNNVITGNTGANILYGFAGNDTLDGGGGIDQMYGGEGDDIYYIDNASDQAFEAQFAWGTDVVLSSVSYNILNNIDNLIIAGSATWAKGNALNNVITGNTNANELFGYAGNDTLDGQAGADNMYGAEGDDTYYVDNAGDFVYEAQVGWGTDLVYSSISYNITGNIDNLTLTGSANNFAKGNTLGNALTGNSGNNELYGYGGNDILNGGLGADSMYGAEGDDTYYIDNGSDVAFEGNVAWGTDLVYSSITYTLGTNLDNLTLTGSSNINGSGNGLNNIIIGNSGANQLFGNAGQDTLDGGAGADQLYGGDGNDTYYVDDAGDVAYEGNVAWGTDLTYASVSHTLGANIDNLTLTGGSAINGAGNGLNNVINGNSGANTLNGAGGADTLNGGAGTDVLTGGAGDDTFVFSVGSGSDTISDFVAGGAEDTIDLSAYNGSGVTWNVTQVGADTLFSFTNGDTITLTNVTMGNLTVIDPYHYG